MQGFKHLNFFLWYYIRDDEADQKREGGMIWTRLLGTGLRLHQIVSCLRREERRNGLHCVRRSVILFPVGLNLK